jgi:predicted acylesterase/phospholipase RssA
MALRQKTEERPKTALILSAGAPHSPLIAGALCALWDTGRTFDVIYTSGAGALLGLLYAAPKGKAPKDALKSLVDLGVSDLIYRLVPIGYKTFFKPGPFTRPIRQLAQLFKIGSLPLQQIDRPVTGLGLAYNEWLKLWDTAPGGGVKRFYNDLIDLWAAAITPTPLHYWSKGVCDPLPFLEDLVDFHVLNEKNGPFHFYMNAFSVTERHQTLYANRGAPRQWGYRRAGFTTRPLPELGASKATRKKAALASGYPRSEAQESDVPTSGLKMKLFYNKKGGGIHPEEVRAAFAYPFIYPPVTLNNEVHFEGAGRDPISFGNLLVEDGVRADVKNIQRVVLIDILGALDQYLLREPRNLLDAFSLSILAPAVAHAKKEIARYRSAIEEADESLGVHDRLIQEDPASRTMRTTRAALTPEAQRKQQTKRRGDALKKLSEPDQALVQITHFLPMTFDIDEGLGPHITDWSHSNMSRLFDIGVRDGKKFWEENLADLDLPPDPRQTGHRK